MWLFSGKNDAAQKLLESILSVMKPAMEAVDEDADPGVSPKKTRIDMGHGIEQAMHGKSTAECLKILGRKTHEVQMKADCNQVNRLIFVGLSWQHVMRFYSISGYYC
jgi:hypothetical protein